MSRETADLINAEFLQKVLKKSTNDDSLEVRSVATKCATTKGDNYLSDIIRATVEFTQDNSSHKVVKNISESGAFDTEIKMMETTLEKMNNMLNQEGCRLSPRVLYTEKSDSPLLVLEDLAPVGYRLSDRQAGIDLEHSLLVMRKIAMFHATSVALWEKDPQLMTSYKRGMFYKGGSENIEKIFSDAMKMLENQVLNWQELGDSRRSYSDKILKASKDCYGRASKIAKPRENEFNVLVHGDAWVNNFLFRYNKNGKVDDLILVDFQMNAWSSPVLDILHFMNTSPTEDVEVHHADALLEEYLNVLTKTTSQLGCRTKSLNMTKLRRSLEEHEFLAVLSATTGFPMMLAERGKALSFDEITQMGDSYVNPVYNNPSFRRRIVRRLIAWDSRGVLDA